MTKNQGKHWRRLNPYGCAGCGKKRYTLVYRRAKEGLCRTCRKLAVPSGQKALFDCETPGIDLNESNVVEVMNNAKKIIEGVDMRKGVIVQCDEK